MPVKRAYVSTKQATHARPPRERLLICNPVAWALSRYTWRTLVAKDETATIFGVAVEDFDYFHEQILHEELGRVMARS